MDAEQDLKFYKEKYDKQREKWRDSSSKYYKKVMNPTEDSLEELKKQAVYLEKRANYQKTYYEANREMIIERQRLYRERMKGK